MLLDFSPFESSWLLSFWILIQAPLSIMSFCVRDILLSAHGWRKTFEQSYPNWFYSVCHFDICFLSGRLDSFGLLYFIYGMGLFKYHTTIYPASSPWVFCYYPPRIVFSVKWMEPQNSILEFFVLSYLQGLSKTSMCSWST